MKKFTTALAVSMLLVSALVLYGCGPNRNNADMANNQPENNHSVTAPETADNSTGTQNGTTNDVNNRVNTNGTAN